jgi:hypothetical protein
MVFMSLIGFFLGNKLLFNQLVLRVRIRTLLEMLPVAQLVKKFRITFTNREVCYRVHRSLSFVCGRARWKQFIS